MLNVGWEIEIWILPKRLIRAQAQKEASRSGNQYASGIIQLEPHYSRE